MPRITLLPYGGLCNRITAICSALQLASITSSSLRIVWERDKGLNCRYDQLFEPLDYPGVQLIEATFLDRMRWARPRKTNLWFPRLPQALLFDAVSDEDTTMRRWGIEHFDFVNWVQPYDKVYIAACTHFCIARDYDFTLIRPNARINSLVDERFRPMAGHRAVIGVHIRRTDHVKAIAMSPTEGFIAKMRDQLQREPDSVFYLATDSEDEKARLRTLFGDRIFCSPRQADRTTPAGIIEAATEVYTLARCNAVWGSENSSFSRLAAHLAALNYPNPQP